MENKDSGNWIKLHRKVLHNEVFRHDHTAWHVFMVLLLLADRKTGKWSGGVYQLADYCEMSKTTLYEATLRLEKAKMINREPNGRFTIYNISNFGVYQSTTERPPNAHRTPTDTLTRSRKRSNILSSSEKKQFLEEFNNIVNRSFRELPATFDKTAKVYTLDEIKKSLRALAKHDWHVGKLPHLRSDYLLRLSTIESFAEAEQKDDLDELIKRTYN